MASILGLIIFGFSIGMIAILLVPAHFRGEFPLVVLLGMVGSLMGAFSGRMAGIYEPVASARFSTAVLGAVILLVIYRVTMRRMQTRSDGEEK